MRRLLVLALLLAAAAQAGNAQAESWPQARRVLPLGGSVTEIVYALGEEDRLVGRDTTSLWPPEAGKLPDVGYVRALSPEGVLSLTPDLIIAEGDAGPPETLDVLRATGIPIVLMPNDPSPNGVLEKITAVAAALDLPEAGLALSTKVKAELDAAQARADAVQSPKRVLFILSLQGGKVMAGGEGSSAEGIIHLAGAVNAAAGFKGYKPITDEALIAAAPDLILMMDREGDLAIDNADVLAHPALAETPAAKSGAILRMDGMLLLGFGPRTPEAAQQLHDALYGAAP